MADENTLETRITATNDTDDGYRAAIASHEAYVAAIRDGSAAIVAAIEKQSEAQAKHSGEAKKQTDDLAKQFDALGERIGKAFSAETLIDEFGKKLVSLIGPIALITMGLDAVKEALGAIFEFSKEGILKADQVRDLGLSLAIFTGGADNATKSIAFFESHLGDTRNTAIELEQSLRKLAPLMDARGFSRELETQVPLMLSQLATIRGESLDSMEGGFRQLLAGRVMAGRNALLMSLGITKADVDNLGWEQLLVKMREVTLHFPEFGQSFKSEIDKIKESLVVTFAEGFNEARDEAKGGLDAIRDALEDPSIRRAIRDLGHDIAEGFQNIGTAAQVAANSSLVSWQNLMLLIKAASEGGPAAAAAMASQIAHASVAQAVPALNDAAMRKGETGWQGHWTLQQLGFTDQTKTPGFADNADLFKQTSQALDAMSDGGKTKFVEGLAAALKTGTLSLGAFRKAEDEAFAVDYSGLGKVKIDNLAAARQSVDDTTRKYKDHAAVLAATEETLGHLDASYAATNQYHLQLATNAAAAAEAVRGLAKDQKILGEAGVQAAKDAIGASKAVADEVAMIRMLSDQGAAFQAWVSKLNLTPGGRIGDRGFVDAFGHTGYVPEQSGLQIPFNQQTTDRNQRWLQDGTLTPLSNEDLAQWRKIGVAIGDSARTEMLNRQFISQFGNDLGSIFQSGGRDFVRIMAQGIGELSQNVGKDIAGYLFGQQGDPKKPTAAGLPQNIDRRYDAAGNDITGRATAARGAVGALQIGFGAYESVMAGGSRTAGTLSGGLAGAGLGAEIGGATAAVPGAIIGAVAGLIVGAIGSAIATAQKQADYKYGIPTIDAAGHAQFTSTQNYTDADAKAIARRIQETYDTIHDSLVRTFMKLHDVVIPVMTAINGQFQPNPSGHFESHLQAWLAGTEGDEIFKQFKPAMDEIGVQLGFGVNKWNSIMADLNLIDPQRRTQLFDALVTAKMEINKALEFFVGDTSYSALLSRGGSAGFETYMGELGTHRPFTSVQREADDEILRFANGIKSLSFEGQIAAESELAQKMTDRASAIRQAIENIFTAFEDGTKKYKDAFTQADVLGFTGADGTVDQSGLAKYWKAKAQQDLEQERFASTPQLVSQFNDAFLRDIMASANAAIASGASPAEVQKWLRDQLGAGQTVFNAQITRLGTDIDKINDDFLTKLDPAMKTLYGSLGDLNTGVVDVHDHLGRIVDPIDRVGVAADGTANNLASLAEALSAMEHRVNTLFNGGGSNSNFSLTTSLNRAAR